MSTPSPTSSGAASGFFLRIRCDPSLPSSTHVATTGGGKRRERDENDDQHSPIEAENGGDGSVSQPSSTLPPRRIALDIEGKTYRFKRLTEEEWLQRRVGGSSGGITTTAPSNVVASGTAQHPVESAVSTTMADVNNAVVAVPSQSKSPEPSHFVASDSPTPSVPPAPQQEGALVVSSSPSPSTTGGAKPPSVPDPAPRPLSSNEVSAKAMPGFEPGDKPADVIKRRNVEQRLKEGRNMRKALRVDAIQTYRLLSGGTNKNVVPKSAEKRGRGDDGEDTTVQKTLIGRGVVVTASFANLDKNGAPIVVDKRKSDQNDKRRRPVPAVQGRAASSSSASPASTSTAVTAFSAPPASTTAIKPNPLRDQIEADLNDYYMTVLAADRRSKLSGRGSLTDYQLDKLLMDMAIRKKEEVTTSLIQGQMQHVHTIQSSVYPPPTVPPSDPPKEAGTAYDANTELAEQYGFGTGRDHGSNYYYALDDGEDSDDDDDVFQSSSDEDIDDEVSDVLQGRFRGKSRYCYQLYTDHNNINGVAEDDGDYSDGDGAPDKRGGDVEDDFGFTELSVEPHRQHMAEQWNSQPADVAQWNSNYDTHFEERDKKEAQTQAANRQRKPPRTAPLSTIKSYLESASGRGGTSVAETYFVDESYNDGGEPEFVLDDVPAYMSSSSGAVGPVGKALGIVKSNIGGEDPEVLYADDDEYDSNAEEHYQGEYPDESPPSSTDPDDDEGIASTDEWDFDGDGAHQHKSNAAAAARRQNRRKKEEAEDDDDSDDEEAEQRYYDPQALGADDGANGMDGFLDDDDDDEDVAPRRFAPGGGTAEDDDDFDIEPSAEGILRKKVVYYELPASDDDEY